MDYVRLPGEKRCHDHDHEQKYGELAKVHERCPCRSLCISHAARNQKKERTREELEPSRRASRVEQSVGVVVIDIRIVQ